MAVNIGPRIGIDGESEYRQQINNIIQQAKTLSAEMKAVAAGFDESATAQEQARATAQVMAQQVDVQQQRVAKLTEMLEKSTQELGENDTRTLKWKQAVFEATAELTQMERQLQENHATIADSVAAVSDYDAAMEALDISIVTAQMKALESELKLTASAFSKKTSAQKKAKAEAEVLSKQVQVQKQRIQELKTALNAAEKEYGANSKEALDLKAALNEAEAELNGLNKELKQSEKDASKFRTAVDKVGVGIKSLASSGVSKLGSAIKTGVTGACKGAITTLGSLTAAAASAVIALGKIGLDYNMEMENYVTNFQTMLGSTEAAAEKVESLKEMAASTPFEMTDLADATQQLLAMGVASSDTEKYLQQLGDISLGNVDKFNSLVGAFGKMNSSGKVTLEYINMMAEQGFNPLNVIAQQTGESMTALYARVSAGTVSFDEIKGAIATATSAGGQFCGGMEAASKTTEGMISSLKDNATALVGEVFEPISESLAQTLLPKANEAVDRLTNAFREDGVNGMVRAAGTILGETVGEFTESLPEFADLAVGIVENLLLGLDNNSDAIADGAVDTIMTLADGLIDMAPELITTGAKLLGKLAIGLLQGLPNLVAQIPGMIQEICAEFESDEFKQLGRELIQAYWDGITEIWTTLCQWFEDAWEGLSNWFSEKVLPWLGIQTGAENDTSNEIYGYSTGAYAVNGSHAGGLYYVPFDGYLAELHQGEMVLTRAQADSLRDSDTAYVGSTNIHYGGFYFTIYAAEGQDVEEIAEVVKDKLVTEIERREVSLA